MNRMIPDNFCIGPSRIVHGSLFDRSPRVRQLGEVRCDAARFVAREQPGSRPSARLLLETDVGERLPVGVADGGAPMLMAIEEM